MNIGIKSSLMVLVGVVFFSCATTVEVRTKNEARIETNGIKKIAVIPLETAYIPEAKLSLRKIVGFFTKTKDERIYETKRDTAKHITKILEAVIQADLIYKLVDYSKLEDKEKNDYAELTDAYIEGIIDELTYTDDNSHTNTVGSASLGKLIISRKVTLKWTYNVINASTKEIIFTTSRADEKTVTFDFENSSENEPIKITKDMINKRFEDIKHDFYPWPTKEKRALKKDSLNDPRMNMAEDLVKGKSYVKAYDAYNIIYEDTQNEAALYNAELLKAYLAQRDN